MTKLLPVILWIVLVFVINVLKGGGKKKRRALAPTPMHRPDPVAEPPRPRTFQQPRKPAPVSSLGEQENAGQEEDRPASVPIELLRDFLEEAAAQRSGQAGRQPMPPADLEELVEEEEEGSHATPMGAPHISPLKDAKTPAIAHMEGHIGEAHGEERHPDRQTALRMLRRKPTFSFVRSPRRLREAVILSEVLGRPRAYKL